MHLSTQLGKIKLCVWKMFGERLKSAIQTLYPNAFEFVQIKLIYTAFECYCVNFPNSLINNFPCLAYNKA
jgi:hypothetical protein